MKHWPWFAMWIVVCTCASGCFPSAFECVQNDQCACPATCVKNRCVVSDDPPLCDEPDTSSGDTLDTDAPYTDVEQPPTRPTGVMASSNRVDSVELRWTPSAHAHSYHIERCALPCEVWSTLTTIEATPYIDETVTAPDLPQPPNDVATTTTLPTRVDVTWAPVTAPSAQRYHYRVTAVGSHGESEPSDSAEGAVAERPVTGYEVLVEGLWIDVATPTWSDLDAPAPTLTAGTAVASQATSTTHVALAVSGSAASDGRTRTYAVRAVTSFGWSAASTSTEGWRRAGLLSYQWERSAGPSATDFVPIAGATAATFNDTNAPADGSTRWYRAVVSADGAEPVTTEPVAGARQGPPGVPGAVQASSDRSDRVDVTWQAVAGTSGYHVYRGDTRLTTTSGVTCTGSPCSFADGGAPAPGAWSSPTNITATIDQVTGVRMTWTSPVRPLGESQSYRVSAINPTGESESSAPAQGWRAAPALTGFEIRATVGGDETTYDAAASDTTYLHEDAPMATFTPLTLSATRGEHRASVHLEFQGGVLAQAANVSYRIRGELADGTTTPWSANTTGRRTTGALNRTWLYAETSPPTEWIALSMCAPNAPSCEDTSASARGARRWYRVELSASGATPATATDEGWRLAFTHIAAGGNFTCAVTPLDPDGGRVWCWGGNSHGELGRGHTEEAPGPDRVLGLSDVVEVDLSINHALARLSDGTVWCWGDNTHAQCALAEPAEISIPVRVGALEATNVSAGPGTSCAVSEAGKAVCWGSNGQGRLGRNWPTNSGQSTLVAPVLRSGSPITPLEFVTKVSVGPLHACAIQSTGAVWCWGNNDRYQLGRQSSSSSVALQVPVVVDAVEISAAWGVTCLRRLTDTVQCFGRNDGGQLARSGAFTPHESTSSNVLDSTGAAIRSQMLSAQYDHACAILSDGENGGRIACWGSNASGELGDNYPMSRTVVTLVAELGAATTVSTGDAYTCAIVESAPLCWGRNHAGQLGTSTAEFLLVPSVVWLP